MATFCSGNFGHNGALQVGQSYTNDVSVTIPPQLMGKYYITVWTNPNQAVFETQLAQNVNPDAPNDLEGDNFKATPITVLETPPADLQVTAVNAPPAAVGGKTVTVSWTVANKGSNPTDVAQWADAVYINDTPDLTGTPTLVFAVPHDGTLNPGDSYDQTVTFTLPPSAEGKYFIIETNCNPQLAIVPDQDSLFLSQIAEAEGDAAGGTLTSSGLLNLLSGDTGTPTTVFEGPFGNNDTLSTPSTITNTPADLTVTNVTVPTTSNSGEPITVSWTVKNVGADVYNGTQFWNDEVWISPDPTFIIGRATRAAIVPHSNAVDLLNGDSYTASTTITLPAGISGKRYIYVFTDDPSDQGNIPSAGSYPFWTQEFDSEVWETNKSNNAGSSSLNVVYAEPELVIGDVTAGASAASGSSIPFSFTVTNNGNRTTRVDKWFDEVFIATTNSLDTQDELLGRFEHDGYLAPGQSYTVTGTVQLPDDISGNFFLIFYADGPYQAVGGYNKGILPFPQAGGDPRIGLSEPQDGLVDAFANGYLKILSQPIAVSAVSMPDLFVSSVTAPQQVTVGQSFTVNYTVTNQGAGDVPADEGSWIDEIFLSRDQNLDVNSDLYLGYIAHNNGPLAAGASYSISANFGTSTSLSGSYYVIVLTDAPQGGLPRGDVLETSEGNNSTSTSVPLLINYPPPTDLQVDTVDVPTTSNAGQTVTITYTVSNHSTQNATGTWTDAVYISPDGTFDANAVQIGTYVVGGPGSGGENLAPGQSYTGTVTADLPAELPGSYHVFVYTNVLQRHLRRRELLQQRQGGSVAAERHRPQAHARHPAERHAQLRSEPDLCRHRSGRPDSRGRSHRRQRR